MELQGKVAFVTGAGSGIGKAAALKLAQEGAKVGVLSHTEDEIKKTADEIRQAGGTAIPLVADTSDADQVEKAVKTLVDEFGRLDIVFANAGINGVWAPIEEITPEEWDKTINTNLRGTYLTAHFAVPHMKKAGSGAFIVTASINGTRTFSNTGATAYSSTKAAQVAFTQMLALELGQWKIRCNVICPGKIGTEINDNTEKRNLDSVKIPAEFPKGQIPLTGGEGGTADEVADLVLFLASDRSKHITGTPIWIDGGQSLLV